MIQVLRVDLRNGIMIVVVLDELVRFVFVQRLVVEFRRNFADYGRFIIKVMFQ